jgi:hypothetical protein
MSNDNPYPTPEAYEKHMQEENEQLKLAVEAARQARINERARAAQQARIIETMDREAKKRKDAEFLEHQTAGMNEHQKKIYKRLMELQPLIESSSGDKRVDYQSEYSVLLGELVKGGRVVDSISFVEEPILISTSGHGLIFQGHYHRGTVGAFDTTPWLLKQDPETKEMYLGRMSVIDKTNILIEDRIAINILDKLPEVTPNRSSDLFPKKQQLSEARPDTKEEIKKKKKGLFR